MNVRARDECSRWVSQQQPFLRWMSNSSRLANKLTTTLTTIKENKNSKISKKTKTKTNPPSYKKYLHTLTYPDPKVKPEPEPWTLNSRKQRWNLNSFFHPKIILYNISIVENNLCFSKKKMFFKRKLNSVLFFIFKIKTSLQKIQKNPLEKIASYQLPHCQKIYDEFLQVFFITEGINVHVCFE